MNSGNSSTEISENAKRRPRRARFLAAGLLLAALCALPAHAGERSASWWQIVLDVFGLAPPGEEPEGGLSIEPGG